LTALQEAGWSVLVVWECQVRDEAALAARLRSFLG
jgi:DNA mismatch endonuclease, patch repair protein